MPGNGKYNEEMKQRIIELAEKGLTDKKIAKACGISCSTIYNWYRDHLELLESVRHIRRSKASDLIPVIFRKAKGYTTTEVDTGRDKDGNITYTRTHKKKVPPDFNSLRFILTNWDPETWKDKRTIEGEVKVEHELPPEIREILDEIKQNNSAQTEKDRNDEIAG